MTNRLMKRLDESTCNFCAVLTMRKELEAAGFKEKNPADAWDVKPGEKFYVVKNDSAIFAFIAGEGSPAEEGFRIIAAHSDSPAFKLKPSPEIYGDGGVVSLNVEKYGGGIMYTWFDRPLSISGRVMTKGADPMHPVKHIIDLKRPVATIPHLAIHFNRAVNEGNPLSVQKDMKPVAGIFSKEEYEECKEKGGVINVMIARHLGVEPTDIISSELFLYPVVNATLTGIHEEFLQSPRLDDLSMCYCALEGLLKEADRKVGATRVMAIFDNEETGSATKQGAGSPILANILRRLTALLSPEEDAEESFQRAVAQSFMISADDAHAWHPNYNEKYDPTNHPVVGGGPVVKINANCKYMTDATGAAVFAGLCEAAGVPCQYFVNHGDVAGGSTLGNIFTSQMDVNGVDMGCAIWGMHSACETASASDHEDTAKVFAYFYGMK
ncbi:MAG: M18 family aminopeptidase [Muribaculaceae bacterium]|nr:M18 family aminopeptidase [Muribaculaceae bacterium]